MVVVRRALLFRARSDRALFWTGQSLPRGKSEQLHDRAALRTGDPRRELQREAAALDDGTAALCANPGGRLHLGAVDLHSVPASEGTQRGQRSPVAMDDPVRLARLGGYPANGPARAALLLCRGSQVRQLDFV